MLIKYWGMKVKKKNFALILWFFSLLLLTSCSSNPIHLTENEGKFSKSNTEIISTKYEMKSTRGFISSIDFELKEGRVEWEIINPKGDVVFQGYAVNEDGKTYRELTYPLNYFGGELDKRDVVKDELDLKGNVIHRVDFGGLRFEVGSPSGIYTLNLKPARAEGSYIAVWSDGLLKQ
jgi:hypothetical protein